MSACLLSSWRTSRMASEAFCPRRICCCEVERLARSGRGRGGGGGVDVEHVTRGPWARAILSSRRRGDLFLFTIEILCV